MSGIVHVDGSPAGGVLLTYKPNGEITEKRPMYSQFYVMSSADGTFALKTYKKGDGVPAGEYNLYCQLYPLTKAAMRKEGDGDQFDGQYSAPNEPVKKISAKPGEPVNLGTIDLKTAPKEEK